MKVSLPPRARWGRTWSLSSSLSLSLAAPLSRPFSHTLSSSLTPRCPCCTAPARQLHSLAYGSARAAVFALYRSAFSRFQRRVARRVPRTRDFNQSRSRR